MVFSCVLYPVMLKIMSNDQDKMLINAAASILAQAYAILRQRYMTGGEALINQWHDRILTSNANSTLHAKASKSRAAAEEDHSMWTAVRGLLHVQPQVAAILRTVDRKN